MEISRVSQIFSRFHRSTFAHCEWVKGYERNQKFYSENEFSSALGTFFQLQKLVEERIIRRKTRFRQRKLRHKRRLILSLLNQVSNKLVLLSRKQGIDQNPSRDQGNNNARFTGAKWTTNKEIGCKFDVEQAYQADVSITSSLMQISS